MRNYFFVLCQKTRKRHTAVCSIGNKFRKFNKPCRRKHVVSLRHGGIFFGCTVNSPSKRSHFVSDFFSLSLGTFDGKCRAFFMRTFRNNNSAFFVRLKKYSVRRRGDIVWRHIRFHADAGIYKRRAPLSFLLHLGQAFVCGFIRAVRIYSAYFLPCFALFVFRYYFRKDLHVFGLFGLCVDFISYCAQPLKIILPSSYFMRSPL